VAEKARTRVVVVTGGATGIGAAIAKACAYRGDFVVTLDPVVELDGSPRTDAGEETTAGRILAAGGQARTSNASVTDARAVRDLLEGLVAEFGSVDAIVNVAGISRPTGFAHGEQEDWRRVLDVHLGGYLTILREALPLMAAAGHGRILGITSGSGWRAADAGAYSCAKRAVASLTWQLGASPPPGVTINALSPIAATRMVARALARMETQRKAGESRDASGGVSLGAAPPPEHLGPIGAYLASEDFSWCSGRVFFSNGSEISVVEPPRRLESVPTATAPSLAELLDAATPAVLVPAESTQTAGGGGVPRLPQRPGAQPSSAAENSLCMVVTDNDAWRSSLDRALRARGFEVLEGDPLTEDFAGAAREVTALERLPAALVVALEGAHAEGLAGGWQEILASHEGIENRLRRDALWFRAMADRAARDESATRVISLVPAHSASGHTRAMSVTQLTRAARGATGGRIDAFAVALSTAQPDSFPAAATLTAHLACSPDAPQLSGAELFVDRGHIGLHSHPGLAGTISYGGPDLPTWLDPALRSMLTPGGRFDGGTFR
jgi:NAD(P)-dependent dehydrogenase (short-subunit alcohol dehydrogenase family)